MKTRHFVLLYQFWLKLITFSLSRGMLRVRVFWSTIVVVTRVFWSTIVFVTRQVAGSTNDGRRRNVSVAVGFREYSEKVVLLSTLYEMLFVWLPRL